MDDYWREWLTDGLGVRSGAYCLTAVRDLGPDDALRRLGAPESEIRSGTWKDLGVHANRTIEAVARARGERTYVTAARHHAMAAFALGAHTLLAEENSSLGVVRPNLSAGTLAVCTYCSVNGERTFVVSRDGEVLAVIEENDPSAIEGADPDVLRAPLSEMGAFEQLDDIELFCRVAGVRPLPSDVHGVARIAVWATSASD